MSAPSLRPIRGGRRDQRVADADLVADLERALVSGLIHSPQRVGEVLEIVSLGDLVSEPLRPVLRGRESATSEASSILLTGLRSS